MKIFLNNKLVKGLFVILFIVGVFGAVSVSMATMDHDKGVAENCHGPVVSQNCSQPVDAGACLDYHLGIIHNLSLANITNASAQFLILLLVPLLGVLLSALIISKSLNYRCRMRFRQLFEDIVQVFYRQVGRWLTIRQQKMDAHPAFAAV